MNFKEIAFREASSLTKEKVRGKIKIIENEKDIDKIEEGNIVVVKEDLVFERAAKYFSLNEIAKYIKGISAVICERGSQTSAISVVCRELEKPCIINLENATKIFKDGEEVEIGEFKILKIED
ncbi:MAG: PEP-utilizing enzyme [Candidatus Aenigmatarchaeota archaeon]